MTNLNPKNIDDLSFTIGDLDLFKIEDVKKCILTLREDFFPRLDFLIQESLKLVERLYDVDVETGMSTVYSPNNRLDAAKNTRPELVMAGRSGKRRSKKNNEPLNILNAKGNPIYIHPAYLCYIYYNNGLFLIEFTPFSHSVSPVFVEKIRREIQKNISLFLSNTQNIILNFCSSEVVNIGENPKKFKTLVDTQNFGVANARNFSDISFAIGMETPIELESWDFFLRVFLFLYPLLDLCIAIGDGRESSWVDMMEKYHDTFFKGNNDTDPPNPAIPLDLDTKKDFNPELIEGERKRKQTAIVQREGQEKFRTALLQVYKGKCVVTGCDVEAALDAAHIVDYSGIDSNHIQNGLLLRSDIHKLFDRKLMTVDSKSMTIMIAPELIGSCYETLENFQIRLPEDKSLRPSPKSLRKHNDDFMQKHYDYL